MIVICWLDFTLVLVLVYLFSIVFLFSSLPKSIFCGWCHCCFTTFTYGILQKVDRAKLGGYINLTATKMGFIGSDIVMKVGWEKTTIAVKQAPFAFFSPKKKIWCAQKISVDDDASCYRLKMFRNSNSAPTKTLTFPENFDPNFPKICRFLQEMCFFLGGWKCQPSGRDCRRPGRTRKRKRGNVWVLFVKNEGGSMDQERKGDLKKKQLDRVPSKYVYTLSSSKDQSPRILFLALF